jgi:DNA invertase Pin-like site-specific DNA recombinase
VPVVWKLGRLGRSRAEMMRTGDGLRAADMHIRSRTDLFDSATAYGRSARPMQGALAECFLDLNRERTAGADGGGRPGLQGRAAEDAEWGRPPVGRASLAAGPIRVADIARRLGGNRDTFYRYFPRPGPSHHGRMPTRSGRRMARGDRLFVDGRGSAQR